MKTTVLTLAFTLFSMTMTVAKQNAQFSFQSGYAPVNGLSMYYEVHGKGDPIILLHGAYMSVEGPIRQLAQELCKDRQVIIAEFQGHGRTADINRPITYEALADDVAALVSYLNIDSLDVFGYSMGGGVALQLAIRHPKAVKKMVVISASYSYEGFQPEFKPLVPQITPALFEGSPFKVEYDKLAPNPDDFPVLVEKLKQLDMTSFDWEKGYVQIKNPMLLVFGDADVVTLDHIHAMFKKLGGNVMGDLSPMPKVRLAILPYTSHLGVMNQLSTISPMITAFLTHNP